MSWERIQVLVREDLEATAPSDAEILARFSRLKAERSAAPVSSFSLSQYGFGALALGALAAGVFWISSGGTPFTEGVRVTKEAWKERASLAERPEDRQPTVSAPTSAAPVTEPALRREPRDSSPTPRARSLSAPRETKRSDPASLALPEASWEEIARAMRDGHEERARELIVQLRGSSDAETRDNARLADVQMSLDVRGGARTLPPAMLATLKDLRATGATSSIRGSARRLLAQLEAGGTPAAEELPANSPSSPAAP